MMDEKPHTLSLDNPHGSWLIRGDSGSGKTRLAATWPGIVTVIDFDNGTSSLMHDPDTLVRIKAGRVNRIEVPLDADWKQITAALSAGAKEVMEGRTRTLVWDSMTPVMLACVRHAFESNGVELSKPQKGAPTQAIWGQVRLLLRGAVMKFGALPCHSVVCMHEDDREDETTKVMKKVPMIQSGFRNEIANWFRESYRMSVRKHPEGGKMLPALMTFDDSVRVEGIKSSMDIRACIFQPTFAKLMEVYRGGATQGPLAEMYEQETP